MTLDIVIKSQGKGDKKERTTKRTLKTHLTALPKAVCKFSVIPIKLPMEIFI